MFSRWERPGLARVPLSLSSGWGSWGLRPAALGFASPLFC